MISIKILELFSTLIIIRNVSNQHIRIISDGSCDTDYWSNDAENSALPSHKLAVILNFTILIFTKIFLIN